MNRRAENTAFIKSRVETITLPEGYEWGEWSGTYRKILRDGQCITGVGGVAILCGDDPQNHARHQIASAERHIAKVLVKGQPS